MKLFLFIMTGLLLTACNPFGFAKPDSEKITQSNWAYDPPKPVPEPLYCYRTLGEHMCYKDPIDGASDRLAGQYEQYVPPKEKQFWERFG